jgi:acetyl-CoA synthetase
MFDPRGQAGVAARISSLIATYSARDASAALLLCDRHDPSSLAYRIVDPNLQARDLTYGELAESSKRLAASLAGLGFGRGDRIATLMGKSAEYLIVLIAIWRLGAVQVPLFTAFGAPAIAVRLRASGTKLVICDAVQRAKLKPGKAMPADPPWRIVTTGQGQPGDLAYEALEQLGSPMASAPTLGGDVPLIEIYTSGTTGTPKGVLVPVRALASFQAYAEFGLDLRSADVFWNSADPGWGYGLYFGVLAAFTTGGAGMFLSSGFSPATTYDVLGRFGVTNFAAAPTVYRSLRNSDHPVPLGLKLRCASSAGEPLTSEVNEWARAALCVTIHDHYGQTEAGMLINNHHHAALHRPIQGGCMGQSMPGWTADVLQVDADAPAGAGEVGRLAMYLNESPLAWFRGYIGEPKKTAEKFSADGRWYITGDLARRDSDGFYFASRDDDVIVMAGYRIGPLEVEAAILTHPAVAECAVFALPDALRGEVIDAAVVLRQGQSPSERLTRAIQTQVKTEYAAHAYPRRVHYVAELPKTPSGKVQRFILRDQLRQAAAGSSTTERA